jgi:hypothetical protein
VGNISKFTVAADAEFLTPSIKTCRQISQLIVSSSFRRVPNYISWFLGIPTVCGLGWLTLYDVSEIFGSDKEFRNFVVFSQTKPSKNQEISDIPVL